MEPALLRSTQKALSRISGTARLSARLRVMLARTRTNTNMCHARTQAGFSLLEIVLSASLIAMLAIAFFGVSNGQSIAASAGNRARAIYLAQEGLEATRAIRDVCFNCLVPGAHGLSATSSRWQFDGTNDTTGIYTRQISLATSTGRVLATSTVSWRQDAGRTGLVSLVEEFTGCVFALGNWTTPSVASTINLPGTAGSAELKIQGNYLYVVRDAAADLAIVDVSNIAVPTLVGSLNSADSLTNIAVSGNYAYVSDTNTAHELEVVNIANPAAPAIVGTFNSTVMSGASSVVVVGTTAYLIGGTYLQIINVSNPAAPTLLGSYNLGSGATVNAIAVSGNYAYLATSANASELMIVNVANPAAPTLAGTFGLSGNTDAFAIGAFGSSVVIGQGNNLYTIDVTNPAAPVQRGVVGVGGTVNDLALGRNNTYAFVATANITGELVVVDISSFANPTTVSATNSPNSLGWNGIAYSSTLDAAFGATNVTSNDTVVFMPQGGSSQNASCQ